MPELDGAIRAVFLDVGGTLLAASPSVGHVYAQVLARFGRRLDADRLDPCFDEAWTCVAERLPEGADRFSAAPGGERRFWRGLLDEVMGLAREEALRDDEFEAVYDEFRHARSYRLYPEARGVLERLEARGYRLGVISNWDGRLPALLADLGVARFFPVAVVSGLEGREKPALEMFERACDRAGVEPREALHVGDSPRDDYEGARAAGLAALLLDRSARARGRDVVHDLTGVVARLEDLERGE